MKRSPVVTRPSDCNTFAAFYSGTMHKLFDLYHPFFRPLWRRVAVIVVCLGWGIFEFSMDEPFWGALFSGLGVYCAWVFLFDYKPDTGTDSDTQ
ncbi:hypothetical protein [Chelativorans sp. YIM 93263]|uniref:hypothetical protein n=1 Tax=Chelativorans sp. YIM 93263 TaxID=2906648 RepID=UPI0023784D30|nr:hypothetical protein [Chelativorans sp. YIM 93263]